MLCAAGELPADETGWAFEVKWDGIRAMVSVEDDLLIRSRSGEDITSRYPELAQLPELAAGRRMLLDGELICLDDDGRPSFTRMQRRLGAAWLTAPVDCPVQLVVFDVLWVDGEDLCSAPYRQRRATLTGLDLNGSCVTTPPVQLSDGAAFFDVVRRRGLEGIVAKHLDAPYRPGRRTRSWRKIPAYDTDEFVVCGVQARRGHGARALHLARVDDDGQLVYAGRVGSGFSAADQREFVGLLAPLACPDTPVSGWRPPSGVICVRPEAHVTVRHLGYTGSGLLRQPVYLTITPTRTAA